MSHVNTAPAPVSGALASRRGVPLRYLVTVVAAGSAGVHAALVPDHVGESTASGAAFAGAAAGLALVALTVRTSAHDAWAPAVAALVLLATAAAYVLSRTTGLPLLHAHPEPFDPAGVLASSAEAIAAVAALLLHRRDPR